MQKILTINKMTNKKTGDQVHFSIFAQIFTCS